MTLSKIDYAYWCGRFQAIAEAVAGEFPTPHDVQKQVAQETLDAYRDARSKAEKATA